jgi:hypothetical protein
MGIWIWIVYDDVGACEDAEFEPWWEARESSFFSRLGSLYLVLGDARGCSVVGKTTPE